MSYDFLVHLNSTIIAQAPATFKLIFAVEVCNIFLLIYSVFPRKLLVNISEILHRNFRLCLFCMCLHYTAASTARCILFYYQINDIQLSRHDYFLVSAHLSRDTVFGYFCAMPSSFAFERFIATKYWRWYESAAPSTLLIIPIIEANNIIPSLLNSFFWTFGMHS
ncbi:hypothetical protein PFISCL1PPCAC_14024, partial [Pristionchus fissidentatus]